MNLADIILYTPLVAATGYTLILVALMLYHHPQQRQRRLFMVFLSFSVLWELALFLYKANGIAPSLYVKLLLTGIVFLGMATSFYVEWPNHRRWILLGATAAVVSLGLDLLPLPPYPQLALLVLPEPTIGVLAAMISWLLLSVSLLLRTWGTYRTTRLPWHANRLLHWLLSLLLTFSGEALLFAESDPLFLAGHGLRFVGVLGLARAVSFYRLYDVQSQLRRLFAFLMVVLASMIPAVILVNISYSLSFLPGQNLVASYVIFLLLFATSFLLYQPYRALIERIANRLFMGKRLHTSQVVRSYSQAISRTLDVEQLSLVIISTISEMLDTSRGALMLVTPHEQGYDIEPIPAIGHISHQKKQFTDESLLIELLHGRRQPLLQYDIDFNPEFAGLGEDEREWLAEQDMDVYVPVQMEEMLTGLIALGPKHSGRAYRPDELELVQVLADQTVIALQNARLYSALNHQNEHIRLLNQDLRQQNKHLELLDKVKTDFITIASHELRTPLTQVKGYTDILQAMNEEQELGRAQIREILNHINRASVRLETLISAMLDASQLEVSGMELSFTQTRLETVVQLAVEPLAAAIRDRQLKLVLRGLQDLPPIHADFKRLVQAFQNLLGNAVKYTPDYGMITVYADLAPSHDQQHNYVEIVVEDSGIGIDPQYHDLIFEKFFRIGDPELHSTGSTKFKGGGPGLGLHIVKGVIEAHGGRIWVESYGEDEALLPGSRFHVVLPLRPPAAQEKMAALQTGYRETEPSRPHLLERQLG